MKAAYIIPALLSIVLTACSTGRMPPRSRVQEAVPIAEVTPTGTFLGPLGIGPAVKVRLDPDGSYIAEDVGPPEFSMMMEGNKVYSERVKFRPQKGRWSWNRETGELTLTAETAESLRLNIEHLRFDRGHPSRLAWGGFAFLERVEN